MDLLTDDDVIVDDDEPISQTPEEREALLAVARLDAVIEGARDAIVRLSPDLKIQSWNRAAQQLFDFELEVVLEDFVVIVAAEHTRASFETWLSSADRAVGPLRLEQELVTGKGATFVAECTVAERYRADDDVTVFIRDLTLTRRLEAEVRQSQKLDAVARLASGMAHEINTPLQYMHDNIEFLTRSVASLLTIVTSIQASAQQSGSANPLSVSIGEITKKIKLDYLSKSVPSAADETIEGLAHISKIVSAMKGLAGNSAGFGGGQVNFKETIESTINVATAQSKQFVTVEMSIDDGLPEISCALAEVAQVVLALVTNSVQAIADKGADAKGTIRISMTAEKASHAVVLQVSDDGCGIPPANIERVFDPFFTTRPLGKGLGQGLAEVHAIVVGRGKGHVAIDSRVGESTTVTATFPTTG